MDKTFIDELINYVNQSGQDIDDPFFKKCIHTENCKDCCFDIFNNGYDIPCWMYFEDHRLEAEEKLLENGI